jgi:Ca2+-binding EF-hand superfamily protein
MSSEQDVADTLPTNFDNDGLLKAFNNPPEALLMLDKNGDGRVTKEDFQLLLEQYGIKGFAGKTSSKFIFKQLDTDGSGTLESNDLTHANGILAGLLKI